MTEQQKMIPNVVKGNRVMECKGNTVPVIPADWAVLGVKSGYNPKPAEALRFWVRGPSGEGKTSFLSSIPNHLILDFDDGADGVPGGRATRIHIKNYEKYMTVTDKLIEQGKAGKRPWDRVTFDTVDEWAGMIGNQLQIEKGCENIQDYGSKGKGYGLIKDRCWTRLRALEEVGYVWSCAGHQSIKTDTLPGGAERSRIRDSIFPMFSKQITTRAEFALTIYCLPESTRPMIKQKMGNGQIIEVPGKEITKQTYYLSSLSTEQESNKQRGCPGMERKFEIPRVNAWDVFCAKYREAVEAAKKQYQS